VPIAIRLASTSVTAFHWLSSENATLHENYIILVKEYCCYHILYIMLFNHC